MAWSVEEVDGVNVIAVGEALDGDALSSLMELVEGLVLQPRPCLVFDLSRCPYLGSEALRFFLQVARRVESQGGRFAFASPNEEVRRFLQLSGVSRLLSIASSAREIVQEVIANERLAQLARRVVELLAKAEARA